MALISKPYEEDEMDLTVVSAAENKRNMKIVMDEWNLGPAKASADPKANKDYWTKMAKLWMVDEAQARRQLCANCEYFDDSTVMMQKMESIPMTDFDMDGGGRGYCHKFDFICHNLRTCQAWEEKPNMRVYD